MALHTVRLGSKRSKDEGLRIGTVRRPPRGVAKSELAKQDWYDVWFPNLAPSVETLKLRQGIEGPAQWSTFAERYRREMAAPENRHAIALLAALSHTADLSIGCYCEDESRCHRSILTALLVEAGATLADRRAVRRSTSG
jgi:uncharacterized protein YeaO (DUF488 family)